MTLQGGRAPRPEEIDFRANGDLDRDAWLTFGLTLLISAASLGIANLLALRHVLAAARLPRSNGAFVGKILVFGKRLSHERPDAEYARRLEHALYKYEDPLRQQLVLLGGRTRDASRSEAQAGADHLRARAAGKTLNLRLENQSTHTIENLKCVREILSPEELSHPLLLVSNRYHLARIGLVARSLGIRYRLEPAEAHFRLDPAMLGRLAMESWFFLWFNVGKRWAQATGNRRMLNRVT